MTQLEAQKKLLLERKSWLNAMMGCVEEGLAAINLFSKIDEQYAIERLAEIEKDYQENLLFLRGIHNNKIEANAKYLGEVEVKGMLDGSSYKSNQN
jgi:hypothetical protein